MRCSKCGQEWNTKSERMLVTCPNCGYKTRNSGSKPSNVSVEEPKMNRILSYEEYSRQEKPGWDEEDMGRPFPTLAEYMQEVKEVYGTKLIGMLAMQEARDRRDA